MWKAVLKFDLRYRESVSMIKVAYGLRFWQAGYERASHLRILSIALTELHQNFND